MKILAVLETMWGDRAGRAPRSFRINPYNFSGRRLYQLVGPEYGKFLLVTNACKELVCDAGDHGIPDPAWLSENLLRIAPDVILVCGVVARKTFQRTGSRFTNVVYLMHPAARTWTKDAMKEAALNVAMAIRRVHNGN